jgi:hypothetical protein
MRHLRSALTRSVVQHWLDLRGTRDMPARADLDPVAMPRRALPFVFLTDVIHDGSLSGGGALRFRYRLIGTGIVEMTGRDITGKELTAEHYGQHIETVLTPFRRVVSTRRPIRTIGRTAWRDVAFLAEAIYLPLGQGKRVDMVLGCTVRLEAVVAPEALEQFQPLSTELVDLELADQST